MNSYKFPLRRILASVSVPQRISMTWRRETDISGNAALACYRGNSRLLHIRYRLYSGELSVENILFDYAIPAAIKIQPHEYRAVLGRALGEIGKLMDEHGYDHLEGRQVISKPLLVWLVRSGATLDASYPTFSTIQWRREDIARTEAGLLGKRSPVIVPVILLEGSGTPVEIRTLQYLRTIKARQPLM